MQDNNNNIDNQFTDFAWGEMSKILDKEMPQKKRNRTMIFWLFGLALITSSLLFYFSSNNQEKQKDLANLSIGEGVNISKEETVRKIDKPTKKEVVVSDLTLKNEAKLNTKNDEKIHETEQTKTVNNLKTGKTPTQQNDKLISKVQEESTLQISSNSKAIKTKTVKKQNTTKINKIEPAQKDLFVIEKDQIKDNAEQILDNDNEALPVVKEDVLTEDENAKSESQIVKVEETINVDDQVVAQVDVAPEGKLEMAVLGETSNEEDKVKVKEKTNKKWAIGIQGTSYMNSNFSRLHDWSSNIYLRRIWNGKFATSIGIGYSNVFYKNSSSENRVLQMPTQTNLPEEDMVDPNGQNQGFPEATLLEFGEDLRNHYLNVPIAFQYKINPKLSLSAGPGFEFLLNTLGNDISKKFNSFLHAGFNFHINDHIGVGLSYKFIGSRFKENRNADGAGGFDATVIPAVVDPINTTESNQNIYKNLFGLKVDFTF